MKTLLRFSIMGLPLLILSQASAVEPGGIGTLECRIVQLEVHDVALSAGKHRNYGRLIRKAIRVVRSARRSREITGRCAWCIAKQFVRRIPLEEQEKCGVDFENCACCFSDGYCEDMFSEDCSASDGTPRKPGTTCASAICPESETVACCMPDYSCVDLIYEECMARRGAKPEFPGSSCISTNCTPPN